MKHTRNTWRVHKGAPGFWEVLSPSGNVASVTTTRWDARERAIRLAIADAFLALFEGLSL